MKGRGGTPGAMNSPLALSNPARDARGTDTAVSPVHKSNCFIPIRCDWSRSVPNSSLVFFWSLLFNTIIASMDQSAALPYRNLISLDMEQLEIEFRDALWKTEESSGKVSRSNSFRLPWRNGILWCSEFVELLPTENSNEVQPRFPHVLLKKFHRLWKRRSRAHGRCRTTDCFERKNPAVAQFLRPRRSRVRLR